jgi:hypothetical protein
VESRVFISGPPLIGYAPGGYRPSGIMRLDLLPLRDIDAIAFISMT